MTLGSTSANATWAAMEACLAEVTYREGWRFTLASATSEPFQPRLALIVDARVTDSVTGEPTLITHTIPLPIHPGFAVERDAFLSAIWHAILSVEQHEAMEFFRVGGVRYRNPHPTAGTVLYSALDAAAKRALANAKAMTPSVEPANITRIRRRSRLP